MIIGAADKFSNLWFGTLLGASFPGAPAYLFADICNGIAVFCGVLCGAERPSEGPRGAEPP